MNHNGLTIIVCMMIMQTVHDGWMDGLYADHTNHHDDHGSGLYDTTGIQIPVPIYMVSYKT